MQAGAQGDDDPFGAHHLDIEAAVEPGNDELGWLGQRPIRRHRTAGAEQTTQTKGRLQTQGLGIESLQARIGDPGVGLADVVGRDRTGLTDPLQGCCDSDGVDDDFGGGGLVTFGGAAFAPGCSDREATQMTNDGSVGDGDIAFAGHRAASGAADARPRHGGLGNELQRGRRPRARRRLKLTAGLDLEVQRVDRTQARSAVGKGAGAVVGGDGGGGVDGEGLGKGHRRRRAEQGGKHNGEPHRSTVADDVTGCPVACMRRFSSRRCGTHSSSGVARPMHARSPSSTSVGWRTAPALRALDAAAIAVSAARGTGGLC